MTVLHPKDKLREWALNYNCVLVNKDRIKSLTFNIPAEIPIAEKFREYAEEIAYAAIAREITKTLREQNKILIKRNVVEPYLFEWAVMLQFSIDVIIPKK